MLNVDLQRLWSYDHMALYKCVYYYLAVLLFSVARYVCCILVLLSR